MSTRRIFLSSLLIGLGVFLLLGHFGISPLQWLLFSRLWPIALIILGVFVLDRKRKLGRTPVLLLGLLSAVFAGMLFEWIIGSNDASHETVRHEEEFGRPFDPSIRRGAFRLETGAGIFSVNGATDQLVSAVVHSGSGHYVLTAERIEESEDVRLAQEGIRHGWIFTRSGNRVNVKFNQMIPWDFHFAVGACRMDLDLTSYHVERVTIETGVSQVQMRLGDKASDTRCSIKAGASSVKILLPHASACEIDVDAPLSRKNFRDFVRTSDGTYRTENFSDAPNKVFISLEAGVSSLTVIRY